MIPDVSDDRYFLIVKGHVEDSWIFETKGTSALRNVGNHPTTERTAWEPKILHIASAESHFELFYSVDRKQYDDLKNVHIS
jgi:hypothetical protein